MSVVAPDVDSSSASSPAQGNRFASRPVRNSVVAALSTVVLLFGLMFVALPAQANVAFTLTQRQLPGTNAVVYGNVVDGHGHPVGGAHVRLVRWANGHRHVLHTRVTNARGVYRFVVRHRKHHGVTVRIVGKVAGHRFVGIRRIHVHPGTAFQVLAKLVKRGGFFFLPVSTY